MRELGFTAVGVIAVVVSVLTAVYVMFELLSR